MKAINASITRGLNVGTVLTTSDNSGAKIVSIVAVKKIGSRKSRIQSAGIGDLVIVTVKKGAPGMKKEIFPAIVVRQKRAIRRPDGLHVKFEDNAVVICKDEKGNPKGTMIKGAVAKEACERWTPLAKLAKIIV